MDSLREMLAPPATRRKFLIGVELVSTRGSMIDQQTIPGANHFFEDKLEPLMETVTGYLDMRLANVR